MAEFISGRFRAQILQGTDVVLTRTGVLGRGAPRASRMWNVEQVEAALRAARARRGEEALDEARALAWAMAQIRGKRE